jgi:hypothetical protein
MPSVESKQNRRRSTRHRVYKEGQIVIKGRSTINCAVRDRSDTGAKLLLKEAVLELPDTFELLLVRDDLIFPVILLWRAGEHIGVRFTGQSKRLGVRKLPG